MSNHWETFPCMMGERTAWISYDHGVREEIASLPFSNCARFKVPLHTPDDRGLPHGEEFARLNTIEDELTQKIEQLGGIQVGRITTNDARYFFFYTAADEEQAGKIADDLAARSGYGILLAHEVDQERNAYWNELFPTDDDFQVIQDRRIEEALRKNGDVLDQPRPIEHWIYFKALADRERFVALVSPRFEKSDVFESPDSASGSYGLTLWHTGLPDYLSMNKITLALARQARECEGEYDGWETQVCKP